MPDRKVSFLEEGVQPPGRFYLRPAERFHVRSWCTASSIVLGLHGLILTPAGEIQEISETHIANSDGSEASDTYNLSEGFLLHLQVRIHSGTLHHGQCYAVVHLVRGRAGASTIVSTLLADYVSEATSPTYPVSGISTPSSSTGLVRVITGTDPATGNQISEIVPDNSTWLVHTIAFSYTTDGTGVGRKVSLILDDGTNTLLQVPYGTLQAPSTTFTYLYARYIAQELIVDSTYHNHLPTVPLPGGARIRTEVGSGKAGDNFTAPRILIEERMNL